MQNVITSTATDDRDEYTITTTYTVGGYTMTRTESSDRDHSRWYVHSPHGLPSIVDISDFDAETPKFGVTWSSGTRSSTDSRAYGAQIMAAADVAVVFNRIAAGS